MIKRLAYVRLFLGRVLLVGLLVSGSARPVWAVTPVVDPKGNALLATISAASTALQSLIPVALAYLQKLTQSVNSGVILGLEAVTGVTKDSADYISDSVYQTAQIDAVAKIASDNPETPVRNVRLCHNMRAIQVGGATGSFHHKHAKALLDGWEEYEKNFPKGNGPAALRELLANRCNKDAAGTGYMSEDEAPDDAQACVATKDKFVGADESINTIAPDASEEPLEMPPMDSAGYFKPDLMDDQQILYMAGLNLCYNAAGPHPRSPYKEELKVPEKQASAGIYAQCKPLKGAFVKKCFDRLAYVSRPDCEHASNEGLVELCESHHKICQDAIDDGLELPDSFGDCASGGGPGLSPFQVEWIQHNRCTAWNAATDIMGEGATPEEQAERVRACQASLMQWEHRVENDGLLEAFHALLKVPQCFKAMN